MAETSPKPGVRTAAGSTTDSTIFSREGARADVGKVGPCGAAFSVDGMATQAFGFAVVEEDLSALGGVATGGDQRVAETGRSPGRFAQRRDGLPGRGVGGSFIAAS